MFGAVGDGVIDDLPAIRDALRYCREAGAPLLLDSGAGYAIAGEIRIDSADMTLRGAGTARPTLHALVPGARIAVGAARECRLEMINFEGAHPVTGEWTAESAFVSLAPDTDLPASNRFTLHRCQARRTRGPALRILRDATETRVSECSLGPSGRVDSSLLGEARFLDGRPAVVEWRGNGFMADSLIAGCPGWTIDVSGGAPDALGVFEEVHVRCANLRVQNGFSGLLRVRDWPGGVRDEANSARAPVEVSWTQGYLENPGTIQDSTTSGGSPAMGMARGKSRVGRRPSPGSAKGAR
jgi:hypothetical protein